MKIIITHQSNSISAEIEENTPEHEAFEVLRAYTVSAFENLPDPLVYSLSGVSEPFLLQDSKDWKEGKTKHFRGSVIALVVVDPSNEADSEESDSYVHITDSGAEENTTEKRTEAAGAKPAESAADEKADEAVIEDYDAEQDLEDKDTDEEEVEAKEEKRSPEQASPQSLCKRVKQFIVEIGAEGLQNIAAVVHTLVTEGNVDLADAIRTAMETSEKAAKHPLTQDLLAIVDVYVQKFQKQCNWHAILSQFKIEQIVALIPNIVDALTRSMEGAQDVELDIAPLMMQFCPMLAQMQQRLAPGEERVFRCNPMNPFSVFQQAQEHMAAEFPQAAEANQNQAVHRGITCDVCDVSPIVGVRYKSVLRADYDLCEECEKDHDPKDPLIKIKTPVQEMDVLPGLSEFRRAIGGGRGRRCFRRGGRGRGCGRPRRGCRPCMPGGPMAHMAKMFRDHPMVAAMRERYCEQQGSPADHRDSANEDIVAERRAEVEKKKEEVRAAKAKVKALKKEMKVCRKEMKKAEKETKKAMKETHKKLDGEVTGHLDADEKSVQKPGATVLKTWKVKNTGSAHWSEDTIAIFHSGNQSLVIPGYEVVHVGACEPNSVVYIRCMLSVPEVEGTYSLTYRLSGPMGKFGGRLTTEFEVKADEPKQAEPTNKAVTFNQPNLAKDIPKVIDLAKEEEPEVSVPQPSAPAPPQKKFQFQKQKDQLKLMGFEMDESVLESVLVACKGDIGQAIQLLM